MGLLFKLKNGETSLKSLRYGNDTPGGGDSGQPFIKSPIPEDSKDPSAFDIDGFIRGGNLAGEKALTDVKRVSKYLFNTKNPSGLLFTAKQNILSRISPKTETSFGPAYGGGLGKKTVELKEFKGEGYGNIRKDRGENKSFGAFNEGIYTPLSTITQTGIGYLGTHLNKQGLDPTGLFPAASLKRYNEVAFTNNLSKNNDYTPGVPINLIRKQERLVKRKGKSIEKVIKAEDQLTQQQNTISPRVGYRHVDFNSLKRKETQVTYYTNVFTQQRIKNKQSQILYGNTKGSRGEIKTRTKNAKLNNLVSSKESTTNNILDATSTSLNNFLIRWDEFIERSLERKVERKDNRSLKIGDKIDQVNSQIEEAQNKRKTFDNRLLDLWDTLGLNKTSPLIGIKSTILSYGGGPGSVLGLGKTNIKFATTNDGVTSLRTGINRKDPYEIPGQPNTFDFNNYRLGASGIIYNGPNIYSKNTVTRKFLDSNYNINFVNLTEYSEKDLFGENNKDYLQNLSNNPIEENLQPWDNITKLSYIFNPSQPIIDEKYKKDNLYENETQKQLNQLHNLSSDTTQNRRQYIGDAGTYYKRGKVINSLNAQPAINGDTNWNNKKKILKNSKYDFCDFHIALRPGDDSSKDSKETIYLTFPALINSYAEDFSADYKNIQYMGRPEPFYRYQGFKRSINMSFTVVAESRNEIQNLYAKLNLLASCIAPSYTSYGYMTGNVADLKVGDLCTNKDGTKGKTGIIEGFTFEVPEEASWDIGGVIETKKGRSAETAARLGGGATPPETGDLPQFPMMIKVTGFKFTPLYDFIPEWGRSYWFGSKNIIDNDKDSLSPNQPHPYINSDLYGPPDSPQSSFSLRTTSTAFDGIESESSDESDYTSNISINNTTNVNNVTGTSDGRRISIPGADFNQNPFVNYNL